MSYSIQTEKKILENLDLYLAVFEHSPVGVCFVNLESKLLQINPRACEIFGYSPDELKGKRAWHFDHPEDRKNTKRLLKKMLAGEAKWKEIEKRYIHKNGTVIWAKTTVSLLHDHANKPVLLVAMIEDLTGIKKKETAFRENEKLLVEAVNKSGATISLLDLKGTVLYINHVVPSLNKEEIVGSSIYNWLSPERAKKLKAYIATVVEKQIPENYEINFIDPLGEIHYFQNSLSPVFSEGKICGVSMISHDITKQKKLEKKLGRNTELMRLGLQAAEMGIWEWDLETNKIIWDENAYKIYGWEPGTHVENYKEFVKIIFEEDREKAIKSSELALSSNEGYEGHFRIIRQNDKQIRWISFKSTYSNNNPIVDKKLRGVVWDSTREKEREINRLRSIELERQNRELKQFSYIASHDLQGPLKTVSNYIGLLNKNYKGKLDENADLYLHFISNAVSRMKTQIKDLLEYSRVGQNKERNTIDLNTILFNVQTDLARSIHKAQATFTIHKLPKLQGYATELSLLFQNLISNALKFRRKNVPPHITISAKQDGNYWQFSIQDNGIGIEKQYWEKIFVIFQRLHTQEEYEGTGIGLAHCQKIVELHGGKIWVESKMNVGSTFFFTLPNGIDL